MFSRFFDKSGIKRQTLELQGFVTSLKGLNAEELGLTLLLATNIRWQLLDIEIDVMRPEAALTADAGIVQKAEAEVRKFQKEKKHHDAAGMAVWMHCLRAAKEPSLRPNVQVMWTELFRGKGQVQNWARKVEREAGEKLRFDGYDQIPEGFKLHKEHST